MKCTVCNYEWCWACGFSLNSQFHNVIMIKGCNYLNMFAFERKIHWTLKLLILFISLLIWPALMLIGFCIL